MIGKERSRRRLAEERVASISASVQALQECDEAEQEWLAVLRERWAKGDAAIAHGDYFEGTPKEIVAHLCARVEKHD